MFTIIGRSKIFKENPSEALQYPFPSPTFKEHPESSMNNLYCVPNLILVMKGVVFIESKQNHRGFRGGRETWNRKLPYFFLTHNLWNTREGFETHNL